MPFQTVAGQTNVAVVAFHLNGIDRVEFSAGGGTPSPVSQMSVNPATGIAEYWANLDLTGVPDGPLEVRATAYPKRGVPRALKPLWLEVHNGAPGPVRWVSSAGDDLTGDGSQAKPFMTLYQAAQAIDLVQGAPRCAGGGLIYVMPGDYALGGAAMDNPKPATPTTWLTVTPAPGVDRSAVRITSSQARRSLGGVLVRLKGVTVFQTMLVTTRSARAAIWLDGCDIVGADAATGRSGATERNWPGGVFVTDCRVADVAAGLQNVTLARSVQMRNIGHLAFDGVDTVLHCTVEGMPATQGRDAVLHYGNAADNVIVYGLAATSCHVSGLLAAGASDFALADTLLDTDGSEASSWSGSLEHVLIWHVTLPDEGFDLSGLHGKVQDLSIQDSVFRQVTGAEKLPHTAAFSNGTIVPGVDNNHFITGNFIGTHPSQGPVTFDPAAPGEFRPVAGSVLDNRVWSILLPFDLDGHPILAAGAIGARQVAGSGAGAGNPAPGDPPTNASVGLPPLSD